MEAVMGSEAEGTVKGFAYFQSANLPTCSLLPDVLTCCPRPGFYGILSTSTMNSVKTKKMGPKIYTNHGKMRENGRRFLSVFVVVTVKFP